MSKNAFTNWNDGRDIKSFYKGGASIEEEIRARDGIDYRYYFMEHGTGCDGSNLDFRNSTTWCLQEAGRRDAKTMLELGQPMIHEKLEEWYDSKALQKKYPYFRDFLDTFIPKLF